MKASILTVTCAKDYAFCCYCVQSVEKFGLCRGFREHVVAVPAQDMWLFERLKELHPSVRFHVFDEIAGKGMLQGDIIKCRADEITGADWFVNLDSDDVLTEICSPQDFFHEKKMLLPIRPFSAVVDPQHRHWQTVTVAAIGPVEMDTACQHPMHHFADVCRKTREVVEAHTGRKFDEYVLAQENAFPQSFNEHLTMGEIAYRDFLDRYHLHRVDKNGPLGYKLYGAWSHGGITERDYTTYAALGLRVPNSVKTVPQVELQFAQSFQANFTDLARTATIEGRQDTQDCWHTVVSDWLNNLTLLDVGAGLCASKKRMARNGIIVSTQEPAPGVKPSYPCEKPTVRPDFQCDVEYIPSKSFDTVTAFDVIEHCTDPLGFLNQLRRIARKHVILTTPNWFRIRGAHYPHWFEWTPDQFVDFVGEANIQKAWYMPPEGGMIPCSPDVLRKQKEAHNWCVSVTP